MKEFEMTHEFGNAVETLQKAGAEPYQRIEGRKAHRNSLNKKSLKARVVEITLDKTKLRENPFEIKCIL